MTFAGIVTPNLELTDETETSQTYKVTQTAIEGSTDGVNALRQSIAHVLGTEQFEYLIYSLDYGLRTDDLIGKDREYVKAELQRRITDCLTQDIRINSVDDFAFAADGENLTVTFDVNSIYGALTQEVTANV